MDRVLGRSGNQPAERPAAPEDKAARLSAADDWLAAVPTPDGSDNLTRMFCGPGQDHVFAEALLSLDCETFTTSFFVYDGRMTVRGDRLTIAIRRADCPLAFRWGDQGTIRR